MRRLSFWLVLLNLGLLTLFCLSSVSAQSPSPVGFVADPQIPAVIAQVQSSIVYTYTGQLTGEWPVTVGGISYTITSRNTKIGGEGLDKATQFVYEHMQALSLTVSYQPWSNCAGEDALSSRNVIGEKIGTTNPNEIVVMVAHLDSMPESATASFGADDNASGSAAVLVAADVLSSLKFQRTIDFVFTTGEEQNLCGGAAYATDARANNKNIVAVYAPDMIGFHTQTNPIARLHTRVASDPAYANDLAIASVFTNVVSTYGVNLQPSVKADSVKEADAAAFWKQGYPAILAIQDDVSDYNVDNNHKPTDRLNTLDMTYFTNYVQASVGTVADLALPAAPASPTSTPAAKQAQTLSTTADATSWLNTHNDWRQRYNVPQLTWDDTLAAFAQDWANQLAASGNFQHRNPNPYGENIFMGTSGVYGFKEVVDSWGNEVNDYDLQKNTCADGKVCGHFTQLIWSRTTAVGCGKATGADGNDYVVCNYNPPGNVMGETPR